MTRRAVRFAIAGVFGVSSSAHAQAPAAADASLIDGWRAVRIADCARCHGKDHEGLAAPSIVGFARTQSRERFIAAILDGNPEQGMPAYRGNPLIENHIDAIYRYFAARADGSVAAGAMPGRASDTATTLE
ncbi:Cytochrome c-555 precursor [Caballeronia temeraria]|uniref:Cytochrome c-555 n=1 Tax=Caballeronia temeraria TaxID=1777137 RepID=A0A158B8Q7_9BURK|nr:cytochrome c [Caballeronia temeraria]SAK66475.1 Cytochrome c-555 precursor [Caballeronia temeraria]